VTEEGAADTKVREIIKARQSDSKRDIRAAIRDELQSFKEDYPNGGPEVEWLNTMRLDEDDWVLRQIFQLSGFNQNRLAHWRLLLGILAEHYVDPDAPDTYVRNYSPAAITASRWDDSELERLFNEAAEVALAKPRWRRPQICEHLASRKRFVMADGSSYKATTLLRNLKKILESKAADVASGRLDDDPPKKADVERKLDRLRYNKKAAG
jgi:hypothetical protein